MDLQKLESDQEIDANLLFSLRKPKDAKAGLASGLKSLAKGIVGGVVGLVAAPVVGNGFKMYLFFLCTLA